MLKGECGASGVTLVAHALMGAEARSNKDLCPADSRKNQRKPQKMGSIGSSGAFLDDAAMEDVLISSCD